MENLETLLRDIEWYVLSLRGATLEQAMEARVEINRLLDTVVVLMNTPS